jgi:hypothetical protein
MGNRKRCITSIVVALFLLLAPGMAKADKLEELERAIQDQHKSMELQQQMRQVQDELKRLREERAAQ